MDWLQILVIVFGNVAWVLPLLLWIRSESRADARKHDSETKELRRDLNSAIIAIKDEMRDFHGRLCAIEERKKLQK